LFFIGGWVNNALLPPQLEVKFGIGHRSGDLAAAAALWAAFGSAFCFAVMRRTLASSITFCHYIT
jgi:hypothetical protein